MSDARPPLGADALLVALASHRALALPGRRLLRAAAVAVVVDASETAPRVLFIRRPVREGDRWSGDLAFPGGLARPGESLVETARREAAEEVGVPLHVPPMRLRDRVSLEPGRTRPMLVRPLVFVLREPATIVADPREVAEAFFFRLEAVAASTKRLGRLGPKRIPAPYRLVGEHRLWGLSLSILEELLGAVVR